MHKRDSDKGRRNFVKWKFFHTNSNFWFNEFDLSDAFTEYVNQNVIARQHKTRKNKQA